MDLPGDSSEPRGGSERTVRRQLGTHQRLSANSAYTHRDCQAQHCHGLLVPRLRLFGGCHELSDAEAQEPERKPTRDSPRSCIHGQVYELHFYMPDHDAGSAVIAPWLSSIC